MKTNLLFTFFALIIFSFALSAPSFSQTGIAVGTAGQTIRTTNGGQNWTTIGTSTPNTLNSVCILDSNIIVAVGNAGTIVRSSNRGLNWTTITPLTLQDLLCIGNASNNFLYAGGQAGTLLKSTNAGINWTTVNLNFSRVLKTIYFKDSVGVVTSDSGYIFRTTNYGNSWTKIYTGQVVYFSTSYLSSGNSFLGIATTGVYVLKSTDVGLTWASHTVNAEPVVNINLLDGVFGIMNGPFSIYRTTNGGNNWVQHYFNLSYQQHSMDFVNILTAFVTTNSSLLYKTENAGLNWSFVSVPVPDLYCIKFFRPVVSSITHNNLIINDFHIDKIFPNPFNPETQINFTIPIKEHLRIEAFDVSGRMVSTVLNERLEAGNYSIKWKAPGLPSGAYFLKFTYKSNSQVRKVMLVK